MSLVCAGSVYYSLDMCRRASVRLAVVITLLHFLDAKIFERCELTRELLKNKYKKEFLSNWICLVEQESERNTSAFLEKSSKRKYYGIFQIGSEWCKEGHKGGKCNIPCEVLLNDDIRDDSACALKVWQSEGFKYWQKWAVRCKGQRLPDIEKCPSFLYPPTTGSKRLKRGVNIIGHTVV